MEKFDKNQYQILLKKFESLKQKDSVVEYQIAFEEIAQGLLLYNSGYDDTYFVTLFLTGLKEKIRSMIALHRPMDVDTASALALVQEEELAQCKPRAAVKEFGKGAWKPGIEKTKTSEVDKGKHLNPRPEAEDKLSALKEFRKKNGLCFKCGNKWAPGHKCPQQVPLHVIEEILDALETER